MKTHILVLVLEVERLIEVFNWWNGNQVPRYEEEKFFLSCLGGKYKISENFGLMRSWYRSCLFKGLVCKNLILLWK